VDVLAIVPDRHVEVDILHVFIDLGLGRPEWHPLLLSSHNVWCALVSARFSCFDGRRRTGGRERTRRKSLEWIATFAVGDPSQALSLFLFTLDRVHVQELLQKAS
jgi:hypothetical protein